MMRSPGWPSIARTRGARLGTLSVLLACGLLLAMVQPAAAKLVERSHDHIVETFEEDLCGIPVITTIDIIENLKVRLGKNGFPLFKTTGPGTFTSTNPATGKSVVETFSGATKDLSVVDNGDGTITVRTAITGASSSRPCSTTTAPRPTPATTSSSPKPSSRSPGRTRTWRATSRCSVRSWCQP
jgi:hypothetical protein